MRCGIIGQPLGTCAGGKRPEPSPVPAYNIGVLLHQTPGRWQLAGGWLKRQHDQNAVIVQSGAGEVKQLPPRHVTFV